jgi:hypothetical protein
VRQILRALTNVHLQLASTYISEEALMQPQSKGGVLHSSIILSLMHLSLADI